MPVAAAALASLIMLSHPLAPKDRYSSISRLPPSMTEVLRLFTAKLTPLMQLPISIPQIGMLYSFNYACQRELEQCARETRKASEDTYMYCGSQRGVGLMTTRKANAPTSGTVINRAPRVATPAYLNVYFGLEIDSRAPTEIMKETSRVDVLCQCVAPRLENASAHSLKDSHKKTSHGRSNPSVKMGVRMLPSTMSCAKHRTSPTNRWLSRPPSCRRWATKAKHSRGVAATRSKGTETGTTPFASTVARCRMSNIISVMQPGHPGVPMQEAHLLDGLDLSVCPYHSVAPLLDGLDLSVQERARAAVARRFPGRNPRTTRTRTLEQRFKMIL